MIWVGHDHGYIYSIERHNKNKKIMKMPNLLIETSIFDETFPLSNDKHVVFKESAYC